MDIKPVNRSSVAKALGWWLLYVVLVVLILWWILGRINGVMTVVLVVVVVTTAIAAVVALRAKNRRENGVEMTVYGARCQGSIAVARPADDVPRLINDVCLHNPELGLRTNTPEGGSITTGISFASWGERIRFSVEPLSATESEVTATCHPVFPLVITNWGRSDKTLYTFLRAVHETPAQAVSAREGA